MLAPKKEILNNPQHILLSTDKEKVSYIEKTRFQQNADIAKRITSLVALLTPEIQKIAPYIFISSIGFESALGHIGGNLKVVTSLFVPILGILKMQNKLSKRQLAITIGALYLPHLVRTSFYSGTIACVLILQDKNIIKFVENTEKYIVTKLELWGQLEKYLKFKFYTGLLIFNISLIFNNPDVYLTFNFLNNLNRSSANHLSNIIKKSFNFLNGFYNGMLISLSISVAKNISHFYPKNSIIAILTVPLIEEVISLKNMKNIYLNKTNQEKKNQETKLVLYKFLSKSCLRLVGIPFFYINKSMPNFVISFLTSFSGWVINCLLQFAVKFLNFSENRKENSKPDYARFITKSIKSVCFTTIIPDIVISAVRSVWQHDKTSNILSFTCQISFLYYLCFETKKLFLNSKISNPKSDSVPRDPSHYNNKQATQYAAGMAVIISLLYCMSYALKASEGAQRYFSSGSNSQSHNANANSWAKMFDSRLVIFAIPWTLSILGQKWLHSQTQKNSKPATINDHVVSLAR